MTHRHPGKRRDIFRVTAQAICWTTPLAGKKSVAIEKDDQGKPDIAVGPSSSGVAIALLPLAEEYKKTLPIMRPNPEEEKSSINSRNLFKKANSMHHW